MTNRSDLRVEPKNEEHVCQAVMHVVEARDGGPLRITDRPDRSERRQEAVEMLFESPTHRYAMEHTRIESFLRQIADGKAFSDLLSRYRQSWRGNCPQLTHWQSPSVRPMASVFPSTSESASLSSSGFCRGRPPLKVKDAVAPSQSSHRECRSPSLCTEARGHVAD